MTFLVKKSLNNRFKQPWTGKTTEPDVVIRNQQRSYNGFLSVLLFCFCWYMYKVCSTANCSLVILKSSREKCRWVCLWVCVGVWRCVWVMMVSLEIRGAKEQICTCWKWKCYWFSVKFVQKELQRNSPGANF